MLLTEEKQLQVALLCVEGRIDSGTSAALESAVMEMIQRGERIIVLDFSKVDYISSAGLRVLLIGAKKMKECQGGIYLCSLQTTIKDVLATTGFLNLFRLFKSKESAVQELTANP